MLARHPLRFIGRFVQRKNRTEEFRGCLSSKLFTMIRVTKKSPARDSTLLQIPHLINC